MNARRTAFVLFPLLLLSGSLLSRSRGTLPGSSGIALDSAQRAPSCTSCHSGTIGSGGVSTQMTIQRRSLALGETAQVGVTVTGGPSGNAGGFIAENTAGRFGAAANTRLATSPRVGQSVTHASPNGRSWTFPYTAPNTAGLFHLYAVGMAADGDGGRSNDPIAFHGSAPGSTVSTPIYIGINEAGNRPFGQGCVGSHGNWPVLFSTTAPSVGSAGYALQLAGAAPSANALFLLGLPRAAPLDLSLIGANGCELWVDVQASLAATTSTGNAQRGEGTATIPLPIPNNASLSGANLAVQTAIVDPANGRRLPITMTDGLLVQIR